MSTHAQRMAHQAFDAELNNNISQSVKALSNLNVAGGKAFVGLLRVMKNPENYPASAEADIRELIAQVKVQRDDFVDKWIQLVESVDADNFQAIADANGIDLS